MIDWRRMCTCALKPENRPSHFQIGPLRVETGHYPTEAASLHLKRLRQNFDEWQYVQRPPGLIRDHERLGDSAFSALDSFRQKLPGRQQGHPLCFRSIPQVIRAFLIHQCSWSDILKDLHVNHQHGRIDKYKAASLLHRSPAAYFGD